MRPFAFQRLRKAKDIAFPPKRLAEDRVVVQQKYDGFKALVSKTDRGLYVYTRRGVNITKRIPNKLIKELNRLLPTKSAVLGELIYLDKGKQSLTKVQSIVGSKDAVAQQKLRKMKGRIEYVVYDVVKYKGKDLRKKPLKDRVVYLKKFPRRGIVHRAKDYSWKARRQAMKDSLRVGGEGIVIKDLFDKYHWKKKGASEPFGASWKFKAPGKKASTADVILESYKSGKEKLIFEAYQIHKGKKIKVGRLSNLDKASEAKAKKIIDQRKHAVAEVSYQERLPSGKLRHMGWVRLRPDKPIKSATVRENPMPGPMLWFVVVETPKTSRIDSSHELTGTAFGRQLELQHEGKKTLVLSEEGLENYKELTGRRISKRHKPTKNPRRSKVKDALAAEAIRYSEFEDFAERYWNSCARGIYWIPVDRSDFDITESVKKKIRDKKFIVYCNPIVAAAADLDVRYMAELNVNKLSPSSIQYVRGEEGTKIKVVAEPDLISVLRVVPVDKALRAFKYQLSLLPSSKEELLAFWDLAWEKEETRKQKEAERAARKRRREERRKEREEKAAGKAAKERARERERKLPKRRRKKKTRKKTAKKAPGRRKRKKR